MSGSLAPATRQSCAACGRRLFTPCGVSRHCLTGRGCAAPSGRSAAKAAAAAAAAASARRRRRGSAPLSSRRSSQCRTARTSSRSRCGGSSLSPRRRRRRSPRESSRGGARRSCPARRWDVREARERAWRRGCGGVYLAWPCAQELLSSAIVPYVDGLRHNLSLARARCEPAAAASAAAASAEAPAASGKLLESLRAAGAVAGAPEVRTEQASRGVMSDEQGVIK